MELRLTWQVPRSTVQLAVPRNNHEVLRGLSQSTEPTTGLVWTEKQTKLFGNGTNFFLQLKFCTRFFQVREDFIYYLSHSMEGDFL